MTPNRCWRRRQQELSIPLLLPKGWSFGAKEGASPFPQLRVLCSSGFAHS